MSKGLFDRLQSELDAREKAAGLSMADVLMLPDSLRALVNWMLDQEQIRFSAIVAHSGQSEADARAMVAKLVERGFISRLENRMESKVEREDDAIYRIRFARKRGATLPLNVWRALDNKLDDKLDDKFDDKLDDKFDDKLNEQRDRAGD